jgi:hypothetical protein
MSNNCNIIDNNTLFVVHCERIAKRQAYYLRFFYNDQLILRIKELPENTRKWNAGMLVWEITTSSLYILIKKYKGSTKIHFDFGNEDSRNIFIQQIKKIEADEIEKRKFVADLNLKKEEWVSYKKELEETYVKYIDNCQSLLKSGINLYPHQVISAMFLNVTRNALLALDMGTGKAQPLDSKLLTPNGWILMGDIKKNDLVIGSDGKPKKVLEIFPQGIKDVYRILFNDGTFTESCEDHLWLVNSPTRIHRTIKNINNCEYPFKIKKLGEIKKDGLYDKNGNRKYYIPMVKPIEFNEKEFYLHPYVLGCLLGDGCLTIKNTTNFSTSDNEIVNIFNNYLPINHELKKIELIKYDYRVISKNQRVNNVNEEIINLKLNGCNSYTKFIPNDYKFSSINQRLDLLRGILDTKGRVIKREHRIEITLASKKLIEDIQFIVQSLGGVGRLHNKCVNYKGNVKKYYRLLIKLPPKFTPFKLSRKIENFVPPTKYLPNRGISDITFVGKKETQCILIDSYDHLYCTDNCILTHNTIISILYAEMNNFKKVFVITPNSLKYNYYNEVEKFTNSNAYIIGKKNKCNIDDAKYIITNYEYFNSSDFRKVKSKFDALNIGKIDCLIVDECHRIKSRKSNTYKAFNKIFKDDVFKDKKPSKIFMSGTPAPSKSFELYNVLHQISPIDFPTQKYFYEYYCGMKYNLDGFGWETNLDLTKFDELFNKIAPFIYRKKKSDILKDLPEKTYQKIMLEMTPSEYKTYYELEEGVANEFYNKEVHNHLSIMGKLREYTSFLKVNNVTELIDSILECGEKFVAIDFYKKSLYELHNKYPKISALHTGDVIDSVRAEMIKEFQDDNGKIKIFLGSESTTKEGLTLTAASKIGILSIPWTPGTLDQCTDRVSRIGQKNAVNAYIFIYKDTIDEYVFNLIEQKRNEVSQVIDGYSYESDINQSIINDLIKTIKNKHIK